MNISPEASEHLKNLMLRPNPRLAEFYFLAILRNKLIDRILVANERNYSENSGYSPTRPKIDADADEFLALANKLEKEKSKGIVVFGHSHPSGYLIAFHRIYEIKPSERLLNPSMGTKHEGGPTGRGDLAHFKEVFENVPGLSSYVGIAADTPMGLKFRVYLTKELLKIKSYNGLKYVPQITFKL